MITNEEGNRYGRLLVLGYSHSKVYKSGSAHAYWLCHCDCGSSLTVKGGSLREGRTSSCGCYQKELIGDSRRTHGDCGSVEYQTYSGMKMRCLSPNNGRYADYGGRGITICERWLESGSRGFENFLEDMGRRRPEGYSIERVDVDGNYTPENCIWIPLADQVNNRRINKNNSSGKTGVVWNKKNSKWVAQISVGKSGSARSYYLGCFEEFKDAVKAREQAELKYFGRIKP